MMPKIELSAHKDELSRLYKNGTTLDELVKLLKKQGTVVSKTTLRERFKDWGLRKNKKRGSHIQQNGKGEQEWRSDQEHYDTELVPPSSRPLQSEGPFTDPDVFVVLFPLNGKARKCIRMPANKTRYVAFDRVEIEIGSRDPTPAPGVPCWDEVNHLVLRFSDTETNEWTIGRHPSCEIVFQGDGISRRHCRIFAKDDGLHIEDLSSHGTAVAYDGQTPVLEKSRCWQLAPKPGEPLPWKTLMLRVGDVCMSVELPNHSSRNPEYLKNFKIFAQAGEDALPTMTGLDLDSHSSTMALGTPSHMQPDIFRQIPPSSAPSAGSGFVNQEARDVAGFDVTGRYSDLNAGMVSDAPNRSHRVFCPKDELPVGKFFEIRIDENTIFILLEQSRLLVHLGSVSEYLGHTYDNCDPQAVLMKVRVAEKRMLGYYLPLRSVVDKIGASEPDAKSVALREKLQRVPTEVTRLQPVSFNRKPCKSCFKGHSYCNRGSPCDMCVRIGRGK
ncbi:hypothetical protein AA0117_g13292 [Alternaria alternata]|uniref:FHA domain-containing protein n=1 Tax=Alternaria alternata TaxID=5599 RepID=A0A4Q4MPI5_ALTAL|nr:hypothetical protein AA0117_g13292 [Alternaria alternata]